MRLFGYQGRSIWQFPWLKLWRDRTYHVGSWVNLSVETCLDIYAKRENYVTFKNQALILQGKRLVRRNKHCLQQSILHSFRARRCIAAQIDAIGWRCVADCMALSSLKCPLLKVYVWMWKRYRKSIKAANFLSMPQLCSKIEIYRHAVACNETWLNSCLFHVPCYA